MAGKFREADQIAAKSSEADEIAAKFREAGEIAAGQERPPVSEGGVWN